MTTHAVETGEAPRPSLYFVNPVVDVAVIGGLSVAFYLLLRCLPTASRPVWMFALAGQLVWVCNWPHFSATSYRLYHSRDNIRQYPMTALLIPWLMVTAVVGSLASPTLVAPCFVKIFLIWSPYHFSGQTIGLTLIYARRAGVKIGRWERRALSGFVFGTFLTTTIAFETGTRAAEYYGVTYQGIGLPTWMFPVAQAWMFGSGVVLLVLMARWCWQSRRLLPPIILLPAVTQYVWFVQGAPLAAFQEYVPFFHSLQYLLIAWSMQMKEKLDTQGIAPSRRYVLSESARWGIVNFLGGAALFWAIPQLVALMGIPLAFATGVVIAGVQVHHFFVDGVIWKLRSKTVSSPLMANLRDQVRHAPPSLPMSVEKVA